MKKTTLIICLLLYCTAFSQQNNQLEKSIFNIQAGFVGAWINNELRLANKLALRTEVGIEPAWSVENGSIWHPNIRIEPRFYYNLNKRAEKGLKTSNNSGNFFGIAFNYRPETVLFSNNENLKGIESFSIVPKWAIRRSFSKNFNYEAGTGLEFRHETDYGNYAEIDLHLRIGYTF